MLIDFEDPELSSPAPVKKWLLATVFIAVLFVGSTLATNVNLGTGAALEFGQGVQTLVTCAPRVPITLKPRLTFVNAPDSAAAFSFTGITLDGIQNTCVGYDFVIKAYGDSNTPLELFDSNVNQIRIYQSAGNVFSTYANQGVSISNQSFGAFDLTFDVPVSGAIQVKRLTLETFAHDASMIRYSIGDTGPAGGFIFATPTTPGNNTGLYFEGTRNYIDSLPWCDQWPIDIPQAAGSAFGTGRSNTDAIAAVCGTGAGTRATSHNGGGYSDWFLPSSSELEAYFNAGIVSLATVQFWTSTQYDGDDAYAVPSYSPTAGAAFKLMSMPLVAVRSFS